MRVLLFSCTYLSIAISASAVSATISSNQDLIKKEILGQTFCYNDESTAGWIFAEDSTAIAHDIRIGMPGPNSSYRLSYIESPRTLGNFDLVRGQVRLRFHYSADQNLYEYRTARTLSTAACKSNSTTAFAADHSKVVQAFFNSSDVELEIKKVNPVEEQVSKNAEVALLSGGCGWAGCEYSFLVTLAVHSKGINSQTRVIAAVVKESSWLNQPTVSLVSIESLLDRGTKK